MHGKEASAPPRGKIAWTSQGYEVHYHDVGTGPAVVFIHGSGWGASGYSNFKHNYPFLVEAGFRAVVVDLLGFGYSSKPTDVDYTYDLFATSMFDLLDGIGIGRATLIGNSLGGGVAIAMALKQPQRIDRLVMMAPGGVEPLSTYLEMPGIKRLFAGFQNEQLTPAKLGEFLRFMVHDPRHVTPELVAERFAVLQTQPKEVLGRLRPIDMSERLGELKMPILGFWGTDDQFCPVSSSRKFAAACPNCRFVLYSSCGHWVMVEYADEFNAYVRAFLTLHG